MAVTYDWISMWRELGSKFNDSASKEKFDDYILLIKIWAQYLLRHIKRLWGNSAEGAAYL